MNAMTTTAIATQEDVPSKLLSVVASSGDLGKLNDDEKAQYIIALCKSIGLNPLSRPIELISLQGRTVPYAKKDCTEQLRRLHKISIEITDRSVVEGVYTVTARATTPDGRTDEDVGSVTITGLKGDALANATMKAHTKAKRRATLSIAGLGLLDESELETVKAQPVAIVEEPAPAGPEAIGKWIEIFEGAEDETAFRAAQAQCKKDVKDMAALTEIGIAAVAAAKRLGVPMKAPQAKVASK